jgi:D-alanyl-D-alanine carboxypeptidase
MTTPYTPTRCSLGSILLVAACLCFSRCGTAQTDLAGLRESLQSQLEEIVEQEQAPGATLAVVLPDGELISLAAGREDRDQSTPMPVGAQMLSGSTGKMFVSAVALQLVGEGKLGLADHVSSHLGKEAWFGRLPNAQDLTIRSLLNHTSGLPRYEFQPAFVEALKSDPDREWTPSQCLEVLPGETPLHPVGEGWSCSDSNDQLLGLVIEKVCGEAWYRVLQSRLLDRLELRHTYPSTQRRLPGLVQGHVGSENFFGLPAKTVADGQYAINPQFEWCGGGLVTNGEDMARFAHHL